jgi:hypothetical protein
MLPRGQHIHSLVPSSMLSIVRFSPVIMFCIGRGGGFGRSAGSGLEVKGFLEQVNPAGREERPGSVSSNQLRGGLHVSFVFNRPLQLPSAHGL